MSTLVLLDSKGHAVARRSVPAKKGGNKLALVLPAAARHGGRDRLRISSAGGAVRSFSVTLGV